MVGVSPERNRVRLLVVAVVVLGVAVIALGALVVLDGEGTSAADDQQAVHEKALASWNAADGDTMAALFEPDGVLTQYLVSDYYPEPLFTYEGRDEIASGIDAYKGRGFRTWTTSDTILVGGPFSAQQGAWEADGTRGGSGVIVIEHGDDGLIRSMWAYSQETPAQEESG